MRRIFADSSVVIAGSVSRTGASRAILSMAGIGIFQLVVSRQVLDECERNLRKKSPTALPYFAQLLASINLVIVEDPNPEDSLRWLVYIEAKDTPLLAAAVQGAVDRLVTLNTKDFTPQVAKASGLKIQTPAEFIHELHATITEKLP